MSQLNEQINKLTDAATAAREAVSAAGDACLTIVAGQVAGLANTCLDKLMPTPEEEESSTATGKSASGESKTKKSESKHSKNESKGSKRESKHSKSDKESTEPKNEIDSGESTEQSEAQSDDHEALSRKKAEKLAEKLSSHVSTPTDPTAPAAHE